MTLFTRLYFISLWFCIKPRDLFCHPCVSSVGKILISVFTVSHFYLRLLRCYAKIRNKTIYRQKTSWTQNILWHISHIVTFREAMSVKMTTWFDHDYLWNWRWPRQKCIVWPLNNGYYVTEPDRRANIGVKYNMVRRFGIANVLIPGRLYKLTLSVQSWNKSTSNHV